MDVLEFIKERQRMCNFYYDPEKGYCSDKCPARNLDCCSLDDLDNNDVERLIKVVEGWSSKYPPETRQSEFLKQYPNAKCIDGVLAICPKIINASLSCPYRADIDCSDCRREFWMKEMIRQKI